MSIYGTSFTVGDPEDPDSTGVVLIRDGGTNHYASPERNRIGSIDGAWIPSWCVPGHRDDDDESTGYSQPAPWYRLSGASLRPAGPEYPNLPQEPRLWTDQEYLLDEDAVRALRDDLTKWLDLPKTRPVSTPEDAA